MSIQANDAKKRRPVVGIMTGSLHTENSSKIGSAISEFFDKEDVDEITFIIKTGGCANLGISSSFFMSVLLIR